MTHKDISMAEMIAMQQELCDRYAGEWPAPQPEAARSAMLWMVEELGEAAAIIKKKGDAAIMEKGRVRDAFTEEMCDLLMYFAKVCLCYDISPGEIGSAFHRKHARNMERDFTAQGADFLRDGPAHRHETTRNPR